ncbi:hypothetical protein DACRYDRAFT_21548 [Dacryopinax primogenitus]|uniref:Uncharacterized protein n=1 Tax=Dacryopinax primogenitus (strain DJM 731) TaxID=1858805 RepID=M5G3V3_DACPD|nr:uncharacterized protein DACRYDRAFT_21548 [Dacryopinax primogenitus]EJU03354.1 hypothetical protein DACRYDRAFT_21548 [Dacryopinax primogenitus]
MRRSAPVAAGSASSGRVMEWAERSKGKGFVHSTVWGLDYLRWVHSLFHPGSY